jgi:high affinity sulfate transporter 1
VTCWPGCQVIVGPEGSIAALTATALVPLAADEPDRYASLAALLALLVGICFLVARAVRLGWVADYFSRAVLVGYLHGVAVVLVIGQLARLLGLDVDAEDPLGKLAEVAGDIAGLHGSTVVVGGLCLASLLLLRWRAPRFPGALLVVVAAIAASAALGLAGQGVATVGEIPSGLPALALPTAPLGDLVALVPAALGIFFVSFSDEILTARSFAGRHGQHVRADSELAAMGAASLAAGISQGFPIGASTSRTAVNDQMGARTQLSGLLGAAAIALVLLFLTEPMRYLPKATLGAVIVAAAVGLVDPSAWRALARTSRAEVAIAAVTLAGVVAVGVLEALVVAVVLSIVDVVRRSAIPHDAVLGWVPRLGRYADVRLHPRARTTPGVLVYRLDDRLFFANASYVKGRVREAIAGAPTPVRWFVFDGEGLTYVDATGVDALKSLVGTLREQQITFMFARLKDPMRRRLAEAGVLDLVGEHHVHATVRAAVAATLTGEEQP